jgi:peptidoglycan hydrolase CwlO-like protein
VFSQLDEERKSLEEGVAEQRMALAEAKGHQTRLENQLTALVAFARSMFQKEAALRRDESQQKRLVLDQISEQLRTQLATVGQGNGRNHSTETPSFGRAIEK